MKTFLLVNVALMLQVGCGANIVSPARSGIQENSKSKMAVNQGVSALTPKANEDHVPAEFRRVDFQNRTYQVRRTNIRLSDGEFEYPEGGGGTSVRLKDVNYTDVNSDGRKEAIVHLSQVVCGGSCDGGSSLFYIYEANDARPKLLTRIETGSLAYQECGLKSFVLKGRNLLLETFQRCAFDGVSIKPSGKRAAMDPIGKFGAEEFTGFRLLFARNRFKLQKREVFPFPQREVLNYQATIEISDE